MRSESGGTLFRKALEDHRTKTVPLFRQAIDVKQWLHSEEKHEPVSDIDTAVADSLKVLDLKRPIREADIRLDSRDV